MAANNLSSGDRLEVYGHLYLLNRSFHYIVIRLKELDESEIFDSDRLEELRELAQELQTEINHYILDKFQAIEEQDWYLFGKIRARREDSQRR